jgi:hypothetical protein
MNMFIDFKNLSTFLLRDREWRKRHTQGERERERDSAN